MLRALFTQDKRYRIGKLKPFIYLYSVKDTVINFNKNECYQINSTDSYILHCASANYTSSSSDNGMYQFKSSVEVVLDEHETLSNYDVLEQLLSNEWYVGIETQEGDRFLMSPEFAAEVTYTYTANDTEKTNNTTVTFTVNTNVPNTVVLSGFSYKNEMVAKECRYKIGTVTELRLAKADDTTVQFSGNSFALVGNVEKIEYNKQTLTFQEQYDGVAYTQTLSFEVPFEAYQHDFHYELLEFVKNEYYALMTTMTGRHILGGFELGMLPSYTITSSEDNSPNPVQITLEYKTSSRGLVAADNVEYEENDKPIYQIVDWNCVDEVYAATLIKQTTNGLTNGYRCLAGYESQYANYNIIGTYDSIYTSEFGVKLTNTNVKCEVDKQCTISGLPSTITFTEVMESKIFTIQSPCDPIFFETDKYTLRYVRGLLTVINLAEEDYTILIMDGDGGSYLINVTVTIPVDIDTEYSITAEAQRLKVDVIFGLDSIDSYTPPTNISLVPTEDNNGWYANIPENEDTLNQVQYVIHIEYDNGYSENITINQDKLYERFEDEGIRQCGTDGGLYKYLTRYIGYYPDDINIRKGYTQSVLVEENSTLCRKEEDTEGGIQGSICVDGVIYNIVEYDGVKNAEATNEFCDKTSIYFEDWRLHESDYECVSGTAYGVEVRWISNDNVNFYPTNETRVSSVEVEGDCVVITPISSIIPTPSALTFESSGGTLTLSLEYNNPVQGSLPTAVPSETWCTVASGNENFNTFFATTEYSVTVDANPTSEERTCKLGFSYRNGLGGTATCMVEVTQKASVTQYRTIELPRDVYYICDGYNKYAEIAEQKSNDGVFWETISTSKGDLIEENSTDCGYIPIQYRDLEYNYMEEWECVGYDKHYKVAHQESTDGGKTWNTISTSVGDLVESNSADCGFTGGTIQEDSYQYTFALDANVGITWQSTMRPEHILSNNTTYTVIGSPQVPHPYVLAYRGGGEIKTITVTFEDGGTNFGNRMTVNFFSNGTSQEMPESCSLQDLYGQTFHFDVEDVDIEYAYYTDGSIDPDYGFYIQIVGMSESDYPDCQVEFLKVHLSYELADSRTFTYPNVYKVYDANGLTNVFGYNYFRSCRRIPEYDQFDPFTYTQVEGCRYPKVEGLFSFDEGETTFRYYRPQNGDLMKYGTISYCNSLSECEKNGCTQSVVSIDSQALPAPYACDYEYKVIVHSKGGYINKSHSQGMLLCYINGVNADDLTSATKVMTSDGDEIEYFFVTRKLKYDEMISDASTSGAYQVKIEEGFTEIGEYQFDGTRIENVRLPETLETIGKNAFSGCEQLFDINIPNSVTVIGDNAFNGCIALNNIVLSNNLTKINAGTFYGCSGLTSIEIPASVTEIGARAFYRCSNLNAIYAYGTTAPTLLKTGGFVSEGPFTFISSTGVLYYPSGSDYSSWLTALGSGWEGVEIAI